MTGGGGALLDDAHADMFFVNRHGAMVHQTGHATAEARDINLDCPTCGRAIEVEVTVAVSRFDDGDERVRTTTITRHLHDSSMHSSVLYVAHETVEL